MPKCKVVVINDLNLLVGAHGVRIWYSSCPAMGRLEGQYMAYFMTR